MSLNSFSSSHDVAEIGYAFHKDPLVLGLAERRILTETAEYSYQLFIEGDERIIRTLAQQINDERPGSDSILVRSEEKYNQIIRLGNIIGVIDKTGRAVGMAGYEKMDDESDHGSGPVVYHNGEKNNRDQFHFKTLGLLKEACGKGHTEELYRLRMFEFLNSECQFAVMKSNNPDLIDRYVKEFGWINLEKNKQAGWELVYESEAAKNGKVVDTLVVTRSVVKEWFGENKTGLLAKDSCIKDSCIVNHASALFGPQPLLN
jgi:hypothetical protein